MRLFKTALEAERATKGHVAACVVADNSIRCAADCRCHACRSWDEFQEAVAIQ